MGANWSTYVMKFVPNVAGNSETRIGAATVRERLAASTRLIRQRPRSSFLLRLVRVRAVAHDALAAFRRKKRGAAIRGLSPIFARDKTPNLSAEPAARILADCPQSNELASLCRKVAISPWCKWVRRKMGTATDFRDSYAPCFQSKWTRKSVAVPDFSCALHFCHGLR